MPRSVVLDEDLVPHVHDVPDPAPPGPGAALVRVHRAGVNFWEVMQRRGRVPVPDHRVPGSEGVGTVEAIGAGVDLAVGDRVAWSRVPGSYAELVTAPAELLVRVPDAVSDDDAAGLLFQGMTAHYLCHDAWSVPAGGVAVVTAAAGGVGVLLTQLLAAQGVSVVAAISSESKTGVVIGAGASHVVTYGDGLADAVRAVAPGGVHAVFDAVGAGVAELLLATLRPRGAMVLYGAASGTEADISARDLGGASLFLTRCAGRDYLGSAADVVARSNTLLGLVAAGTLRPVVGATYDLAETVRAWDDLESRGTVGKLLLAP